MRERSARFKHNFISDVYILPSEIHYTRNVGVTDFMDSVSSTRNSSVPKSFEYGPRASPVKGDPSLMTPRGGEQLSKSLRRTLIA